MIYFTSDTHFGHENIIRFCKRPFVDAQQMDEVMIANWNAVVSEKDEVYHLGDFSFRSAKAAPTILDRLKGRIHLIHGNHDSNQIKKLPRFLTSQPYAEIKVDGENVVLCHYALRTWNKAHYGAYHLYGHSHGGLPGIGRSLDVGVDVWGFRPVTLAEIKERLTEMSHLDV